MEIVHGFKPLTIFVDRSVLDVWMVLALCFYATVVACCVCGALFYLKFCFKKFKVV